MATHSSILAWRISVYTCTWRATVYGVTKSLDVTERLTTHTLYHLVAKHKQVQTNHLILGFLTFEMFIYLFFLGWGAENYFMYVKTLVKC